MNFIKSLLFWFVAIIVFFVALLAAVDNSDAVALTFLDWSTPAVPVSWWVLAAFIIGVVFTLMVNTWSNTRLRLKARQANKQVSKINESLDKAKAGTGSAVASKETASKEMASKEMASKEMASKGIGSKEEVTAS
jgi:putative membrane protein